MATSKKILFVVEGRSGEPNILNGRGGGLLSKILALTEQEYEITVVGGSIYDLYRDFKAQEYNDLVAYLRDKGKINLSPEILSNEAFSAIYLMFDYDPQYQCYSESDIKEMIEIFNNETELGKLYLNYPMVESFYHVLSTCDEAFLDRTVGINDIGNGEPLKSDSYKKLVHEKTCFDLNLPIKNKELCYAIFLNYKKIEYLLEKEYYDTFGPDLLNLEIAKKNESEEIYVLCSCLMFTVDYNLDLVSKKIKKEIGLHLV